MVCFLYFFNITRILFLFMVKRWNLTFCITSLISYLDYWFILFPSDLKSHLCKGILYGIFLNFAFCFTYLSKLVLILNVFITVAWFIFKYLVKEAFLLSSDKQTKYNWLFPDYVLLSFWKYDSSSRDLSIGNLKIKTRKTCTQEVSWHNKLDFNFLLFLSLSF